MRKIVRRRRGGYNGDMDDDEKLDVIAVGAHPDDVEIACGGTLAKLAQQGYRVGIIDLTDGEPTPASPGPEVRLAEARAAAEVLGAKVRVTLDLPNRRLFDTFEARVALAKQFRKHRPRLVIGLGARTPLASPDHWQARQITEAGVFYSKLTKWDEYFDDYPVHVIPAFLYCFLSFRSLATDDRAGHDRVRHQRRAGEEDGRDRLLQDAVPRGQVATTSSVFAPMPSNKAWPPASKRARCWPARPLSAPAT